ncbi:hypothetical protein DESA109040_13540 [Deinococcus saxicola]
MTRSLRQGVVDASTTPTLAGTVEIDEVYLVAGHKGQSDLVKKNLGLALDDVRRASEDAARPRPTSHQSWA